MVKTLQISRTGRREPEKQFKLGIREYDGVDVWRNHLLWLSKEQAAAIMGVHTGIFTRWGDDTEVLEAVGAAPLPIQILRVPDRQPMTAAWLVKIGDKALHRLNDDVVTQLHEAVAEGGLVFEPGQPDWDLRRIEDIRDRIAQRKQEIAELENRELSMVETWRPQRALEPDQEGEAPLKDLRTSKLVGKEDLPEGVTVRMIREFCSHAGVEFYALGRPPSKGHEGWEDREHFRVATNTYPAVGHTVRWDAVLTWVGRPEGVECAAPAP